ncbi:WD repeat-containing protein 26 homolog [Lycium barbarum]|uniref:WD repeat-containing protein 26 homolog n=1 Tax=Lycium barbarum TaxID=112863 RepID=UPI00293ED0FC|nr:WD repeat-containing protein 26 homolog [Lycium barbarum]XP_060209676.1 WD repeat-containing protein 26 homolog [Lycium barbarum]XP_060209677.1 WD repeat-containing protein 26 homolog [Lycium barbarum]XP_060209678.1 WD repeat-containing protein 26 homolog [Lycium barbarum]XP_060209679.1 WD repeat-containing protein 26 homolog [Lycium barbarum]XP_060209680.1 WD repeat-containing protein 26 homolog [Lycium barbarum]XP_060209681.1 WD repeat-containing protein 26 homolog [Lycium barbarum]XP_0
MGGAEDDEPLSKRVKISFGESADRSNGTLFRDPASCSMVRPLEIQGDDEIVGTKGVVKKAEFVRIIAEALNSLGYMKTGAYLEEESGIPLHPSPVNLLMQQILDGKWDESVATLHQIGLVDGKIVKLASFVILEQKFFELLERGKITHALKTLRTEIAPLCINNDRVRELSLCIISPSQQVVKIKSRTKLLEEMQRLLPPSVMIPEKRLIHLVEQALQLQLESCMYHNSLATEMSLLTDHECGIDQIPSRTLQILQEHKDEVWFLQFSHNGKYLASSSADCSVIIWEMKLDGRFCLKHRFSGHEKPVSYISWGPDDNQLLTCGEEEVVRRWDVSSGECIHTYMKHGLGLTSCGWAPDGKRIFCGVTDKSISMWDLAGKELECWKGHRISRIADLEITRDGKHMVSVCKDNMILLFGLESKEKRIIQEDEAITSFVLSADNRYILISLWNEEIHLWSIEGSIRLIAIYKGHKRERFVVRSCFGGIDQSFIASGSENSQVCIWHKCSSQVIVELAGHSGTVNCVSWNPANPHMLASASDDRTIRIWGLASGNMKHNSNATGTVSNGVHYCNGGS